MRTGLAFALVAVTLLASLGAAVPLSKDLAYAVGQAHLEQVTLCHDGSLTQDPPGSRTLAALTGRDPTNEAAQSSCATLDAVASIEVVRTEEGKEGQLTIRFLLPYTVSAERYPLPYHQDPRTDTANFTDDALRDAVRHLQALPGQGPWVPLVVNPNNATNPLCLRPVACAEEGPVANLCDPCHVGWESIDTPEATAPLVGPAPRHEVLPATTLHLERAGMVETVHRLEVRGFDAEQRLVYEEVFTAVALVDHTATERLKDLQGTTFTVTTYLTPVDEALGNALETLPAVHDLDLPTDHIVLDLVSFAGQPRGGCAYGQSPEALLFDLRDGGCVSEHLKVWGGCPHYSCQGDADCLRRDRCTKVLGAGQSYQWYAGSCRNPAGAGNAHRSQTFAMGPCVPGNVEALAWMNTGLLAMQDVRLRVTPVWRLTGGIDQLCSSPNPYAPGCAATGAYLGLSFAASSRPVGGGGERLEAYDRYFESIAYAVEWCVPNPESVMPFKVLAPFTSCWATISNGGQEQAFQRKAYGAPFDLDAEANRVYHFRSDAFARVCCANPHNLPSFPEMTVAFEGFRVEVAPP